MKFEVVEPPNRFWRCNIASVDVIFDFVSKADLKSPAIVALMDVLADVLQGCESHRALDVHVTVVSREEVWIIWDYPSVVEKVTAYAKGPSVIGAMVKRIALPLQRGSVLEGFREALRTPTILHTGRIWIHCSAGAVNHEALDGFEEHRFGDRIRPCRTYG